MAKAKAAKSPGQRLRDICLGLPEAIEQETWDLPTYRVRGKIFAMEVARDGRLAFWCKGLPGSQEILVGADPERFFVPPYFGPKGWIGMWIDRKADWREVAELVRRSYRQVAPKKLAEQV
ncbi:MmcQ/YjbR family DNA-binding protein [Ferrovibrio sp.]|uniref:MmcQ/YjbR family DNA-binding protein n=1 Tax=Ferrovibrio sp. TaxID=1917215 RepID=UPI003D12C9C8